VLQDIRQIGVDRIVVGGDVLPGPMVREVLEFLLALDTPVEFIRGNCEVAGLAELAGKEAYSLPESVRSVIRWSARQLNPEHIRAIESWPKTLELKIEGAGRVLFCHGTPRDENEIFSRLTPEDRLLTIFGGLDADIVICGHTHMQFDRKIGSVRVLNAGSVGMPFGKAGAFWLLLGPQPELRHTSYDLNEAAIQIRNTTYPQAEEFAAKYVLQPPSEEEMLRLFSQAELKR